MNHTSTPLLKFQLLEWETVGWKCHLIEPRVYQKVSSNKLKKHWNWTDPNSGFNIDVQPTSGWWTLQKFTFTTNSGNNICFSRPYLSKISWGGGCSTVIWDIDNNLCSNKVHKLAIVKSNTHPPCHQPFETISGIIGRLKWSLKFNIDNSLVVIS